MHACREADGPHGVCGCLRSRATASINSKRTAIDDLMTRVWCWARSRIALWRQDCAAVPSRSDNRDAFDAAVTSFAARKEGREAALLQLLALHSRGYESESRARAVRAVRGARYKRHTLPTE